MEIRPLSPTETPPYDLLLLADPSRPMIDEYVKQGKCFLLEESGTVIGVYVLLQTRPGTVELMNIAVAETHQGKGLGKKLLLHAVEQGRAGAYQTIKVGTGNSSFAQLALYQKAGFRITGIDRDFFTRNYEEEIWENGIRCRDMIRLERELP
ncbi:GNAT family N-acetyltransferase [Domibacillus indicus]|uniref:GNAT family N-acetyltransferase n=1 Tax=Domibacillus indicus TaxID=1437523 RepID=UPI000617E877|nr:GNAT family N-acetyltransferase [Domibacillus indicus]